MAKNNNLNPRDLFGNLTISRYSFTLRFDNDSSLPEYPSLAIRGLLGWTLQETVCPFLQKKKYECKKCIIRQECPYFCLYEQQATIHGLADAPKGYILYSAPNQPGREIKLDLTLFGSCNNFLPAVMEALFSCGEKGLGSAKNHFTIISLQEITPAGQRKLVATSNGYKDGTNPYPLVEWFCTSKHITKIKFITPIRLRKKGRYIRKLDWPFFYSSLARRLEGLNKIYGDGRDFGREKWLTIIKEFDRWQQPVGKTKWLDLQRYSSRQHKKLPLGGLIGDLQLNSFNKNQQLWLQAAALINVGKGAMMGLGRIEIS